MATLTKTIGLSLGADICWPICYEELVKRLDLKVPAGDDELTFRVERLSIEPFDLKQPCKYAMVLDRLTHWYHTSREWIKKSVIMDGLYVLNNPWSIQSMEKQTTYCAMMRLGLPIPATWMVPPKEYESSRDLDYTLRNYAKLFDLGVVGKKLGYPLFMKPYDGGGWRGVTRINDEGELRSAYEQSGKMVMHLQEAVLPYRAFVRCIGLGPQVHLVSYDPAAPLHARYVEGPPELDEDECGRLRAITLIINSFFGWDFNSCEALLQGDTWHPIDFANPCPDSQVTSLHWHFPWLVKANVRWSLFCAATGRKMHINQNWRPFFDIADRDLPQTEKVAAYYELACAHFDSERFETFCREHLGALDEIALDFFGSEVARDAVRQKVTNIFPAHEVEEFTTYFWEKIQSWRRFEAERLEKA